MTSEGESAADAGICFGLNDGSIWQMEKIGKSCLVSLVKVVRKKQKCKERRSFQAQPKWRGSNYGRK